MYNPKHIKEESKTKYRGLSKNQSDLSIKETKPEAAAETVHFSAKRHWKIIRLYIKVISQYKQSNAIDRKSLSYGSNSNHLEKHDWNEFQAQKYNSVSVSTLSERLLGFIVY